MFIKEPHSIFLRSIGPDHPNIETAARGLERLAPVSRSRGMHQASSRPSPSLVAGKSCRPPPSLGAGSRPSPSPCPGAGAGAGYAAGLLRLWKEGHAAGLSGLWEHWHAAGILRRWGKGQGRRGRDKLQASYSAGQPLLGSEIHGASDGR
jgi:hypothetical protein